MLANAWSVPCIVALDPMETVGGYSGRRFGSTAWRVACELLRVVQVARQSWLLKDDACALARLMVLGDEYVLPERYNDAYHVVGDGLVVPVVKHLAEHILEPLLTNFDHWGPVITLRFP